MSIQLIDNTIFGTYGKEGEALFNELQTLVAPKSWQLDYIPEEGRFSIIGCGPTVNKSEIEAIFARRTQHLSCKTEILDTFYYGNRQFTLIPSAALAQRSRSHFANNMAPQAYPPVPNIFADPSLQSPIDETRSAFAQAFNTTVDERAAQLVSRILAGLGPYQPGAPLRIVRIEGLNDPSLQVAIAMAFSNANAGIQLVWVDSDHEDTTSGARPALCSPFSPIAPLESSRPLGNPTSLLPSVLSNPFEFGIASDENQSSLNMLRQFLSATPGISDQHGLNRSGLSIPYFSTAFSQTMETQGADASSSQQPPNALTLQELQQIAERSVIPGIGRVPRRPTSPLEARALEILSPALAAASQLRPEQPAIQWTVATDEVDEPLWEAMHRILCETQARINLVRMQGTITRNHEGR
jgi:hypothetical protein